MFFQTHMKSHGIAAYICLLPGCPAAYQTNADLKSHYINKHGFTEEQIPRKNARQFSDYMFPAKEDSVKIAEFD